MKTTAYKLICSLNGEAARLYVNCVDEMGLNRRAIAPLNRLKQKTDPEQSLHLQHPGKGGERMYNVEDYLLLMDLGKDTVRLFQQVSVTVS